MNYDALQASKPHHNAEIYWSLHTALGDRGSKVPTVHDAAWGFFYHVTEAFDAAGAFLRAFALWIWRS